MSRKLDLYSRAGQRKAEAAITWATRLRPFDPANYLKTD